MKRTCLALALAVLVTQAPVYGHHSFAGQYFEEQSVSIDGTLVEFAYRNPHAWVHLIAKDENGELQKFSAEWSNPNRLKQQGLTAESLKPGDQVVITGSPGRNAADRRLHLRTIERPADGWKWPVARARR